MELKVKMEQKVVKHKGHVRLDCLLAVIVKLTCLIDLNGYAGGELVSAGFNHARLLRLDKYSSPWSSKVPGWVLG